MRTTILSLSAAFVTAVLVYVAMLMFATGMYVETVGNVIVLSSIGAGIVTALILRIRDRRE